MKRLIAMAFVLAILYVLVGAPSASADDYVPDTPIPGGSITPLPADALAVTGPDLTAFYVALGLGALAVGAILWAVSQNKGQR